MGTLKVRCVVEGGGNRRWRFYPVQDTELMMMAMPPLGIPVAACCGALLTFDDAYLRVFGVVGIALAAWVSVIPCLIARRLLKKCDAAPAPPSAPENERG